MLLCSHESKEKQTVLTASSMAQATTNNIPMPSLATISSIFLLLFSSPTSFAAPCNAQDKKALQSIKSAFHNAETTTLASWTDSADCCAWSGVQCAIESGRVVSLEILNSPTLSGSIPDAIAGLSFLTRLVISGILRLTGSIPHSLSHLQNLSSLDLSRNSLSGPFPPFLSSIKSLQAIDFSNNQLTGSIPRDLARLPRLFSIKLSHNQLTGSIPAALGSLTATVPELDLSNNRLSGKIPPELGKPDWSYIDLSNNRLSGDASVLFGVGKSVTRINIQINELEFNLGAVIFPRNLAVLKIDHNRIFGSIPNNILQLQDLRVLDLSQNQLCNQIPLGDVTARFGKTAFAGNKCLCGGPFKPCSL